MAIDTNSLVALRATNLLLTPTLSRDYIYLYQLTKSIQRAGLYGLIDREYAIELPMEDYHLHVSSGVYYYGYMVQR